MSYLLLEDGVSKFTLEDGSGFLLLESAGDTLTAGGALAQGNSLAAAVLVGAGTALAQGNASAAVALLTAGGAIAGGNIFIESTGFTVGQFDRPTPRPAMFDQPTPE